MTGVADDDDDDEMTSSVEKRHNTDRLIMVINKG